MEDISRDLEREIKSYSKPSRSKRKTDKRLIVVDDFGNMKSADWVRRAARLFFYLSLILGAAAGTYYWLYSDLKKENRRLESRVADAQERVDQLTARNERLMARVVLAGGTLEDMEEDKRLAPSPEKDADKTAVKPEKPEARADETDAKTEQQDQAEILKTDQDTETADKENGTDINEKVVDIENFRTTNDTDGRGMLVRFKITNVTDEPGDISGRIFVMLYPENGKVKEGLVVPTVPVQDGIPVNPDRGQFFSIAHFKPVKFRIRNTPDTGYFKYAEVVVFNQEDELVLRKRVPMNQENE